MITMTITVDYENGEVVPDDNTIQHIKQKIADNKDFTIGSDLLYLALRVEIREGRLPMNCSVEGENMYIVDCPQAEGGFMCINKWGKSDEYPSHVLDNLLDKILGI